MRQPLQLLGEYLLRTALAWFAPVAVLTTAYQLLAIHQPEWQLPPLSRLGLEIIALVALFVAPVPGYIRLGVTRDKLAGEVSELRRQVGLYSRKIERLEEHLSPPPPASAAGGLEIISQEDIGSPMPAAPYGKKVTVRTPKLLSPARIGLDFDAPIFAPDECVDYGLTAQTMGGVSSCATSIHGTSLLFELQSPPLGPEGAIWICVYSPRPFRAISVRAF